MGVWLNKNFIEISKTTSQLNAILERYSYKDIDEEFINAIVNDEKIKWIQISDFLPDEAYAVIDSILAKKPELYVRIYDLYGDSKFDISFLERMPHLNKLRIDCYLRSCPDMIDFNILTKLDLKALYLNAFDLRDYGFLQSLSEKLEELVINADTMGGAIKFDCKWLLRYNSLKILWLGKKAKKNIGFIAELPVLESLSLRGIKLSDFEFLKQMNLRELHLLWNSNNDLEELKHLTTLKEIELWRINKLDNIDFISKLTNLEVIRLQDLRHVTRLPDLSELHNLNKIVLDKTGIEIENVRNDLRDKIEFFNYK